MGHPLGPSWTIEVDGVIRLEDGRYRAIFSTDAMSEDELQTLVETFGGYGIPFQLFYSFDKDEMASYLLVLSEQYKNFDKNDVLTAGGKRKDFLRLLGYSKTSFDAEEQRLNLWKNMSLIRHMTPTASKLDKEQIYKLIASHMSLTSKSRYKGKSGVYTPEAFEWSLVVDEYDGLEFGHEYYRGLTISDYPAAIKSGELLEKVAEVSKESDARIDLSCFVVPIEKIEFTHRLRKKVARLEAELIHEQEKGLLPDFVLRKKWEDTMQLIEAIEQCRIEPVQMAIHVGVSGEVAEVQKASGDLSVMMSKLKMRNQHSRQVQSKLSCLPVGVHALSDAYSSRVIPAHDLAALLSG